MRTIIQGESALSEYSNNYSAQYTTINPEIKETNKTQHSPTSRENKQKTSRLGMKKKKTVLLGSSNTKGYYLCIKLGMVG
jgi:hypothetical protein